MGGGNTLAEVRIVGVDFVVEVVRSRLGASWKNEKINVNFHISY
jgi:hypothetical protein